MSAVAERPQSEIVAVARQAILDIEAQLSALPPEGSGDVVERTGFVTAHQFCPGVYARTIYMPAGTVLTSKIHKTQHFFLVSQGECIVIDSHGTEQHISAPHLGITLPGTKRALRIIADCIWTTFHPTTLTDVDDIERHIMAESFEAFDQEQSAQEHAA